MLVLSEVSTAHHLFILEIKVTSSKEQLNFTTERREGMQNKGALDCELSLLKQCKCIKISLRIVVLGVGGIG